MAKREERDPGPPPPWLAPPAGGGVLWRASLGFPECAVAVIRGVPPRLLPVAVIVR